MTGQAVTRVLPSRSARDGRRVLITVAGVLAFLLGALGPTHFASDFVLKLANEGLLLGILALSVAFLMSQAGLVALGAASLYGGVGYLFANAVGAGLSPGMSLIVALAVSTGYAALLGALFVRTNPLAFMMLTLAAGEMASHSVMLEGMRDYTSGADGLVVSFDGTVLGLHAADFASPTRFWPIAWTAAWIAGLAVWAVRRSRFGAVLRAIRVNEERMRFSGYNTYLPRLTAFVFVSAISAVCGLLHVLNAGFVSPESLGLSVSTNALVAALIGGTGGSLGPIAGGVFYTFAQDEFGAYGLTQLLTGAAIVIFIVLFPRGVVGGVGQILARRFAARERR